MFEFLLGLSLCILAGYIGFCFGCRITTKIIMDILSKELSKEETKNIIQLLYKAL